MSEIKVWFEREDVGAAASNELCSPGLRPEFRFPSGLCNECCVNNGTFNAHPI